MSGYNPIFEVTTGENFVFEVSGAGGGMIIEGNWNADTNDPDIDGATEGQAYRVSVAGTHDLGGINSWVVDDIALKGSGATWYKLSGSASTGGVSSVNGETGNVILDASDIGLGNVDNTSDADKPISTAQAVVNALKLNVADVIDNVSTTTTNQALSANQGKLLNDAIVALQGSLIPQGAWDADTNTPTLPGAATTGEYWIVSVDGNTALGGITDWEVNDWAVKTATGWAKVDNTDAVLTVAGRTGNVVIAIADIAGLQTAIDAKSNIADIVDNLTSTSAVVPLSANMGRELKAEIDNLGGSVLEAVCTTATELQTAMH